MNPYAKRRTKETAYAVYQSGDWTWYVLKTYQAPAKAALNPFARALCLVVTPDTGERGHMADVYFLDIGGKLVAGEVDVRALCRPASSVAERERQIWNPTW